MPPTFTRFVCYYKLAIIGLLLSCIIISPSLAQNTVTVRIEEGQATSTCTDGFDGEAEPLWQVNVEGEGYITYSECEESLPNTQFTTTLDCLGELKGGEIQVCLKVFENDPRFFDDCHIDMECEEEYCDFFVIPLPGASAKYELAIPEDLASGGKVSFTVSTEGEQQGAMNDHICHAIDLGVLNATSGTLGNKDLGIYNNFCATAIQEINPFNLFPNESFTNNVGVWFQFNTGDQPSELLLVEALSDPEAKGDPVSLQLALFQSNDNTCTGELLYITEHHDAKDNDEFMLLECLPPNQDFYILVDAVYDASSGPDFPLLNGYFSLAIESISVTGDNDFTCEAQTLEVIEGDSKLYTHFFNHCATNTADPVIANFPSLHPVWFQFQPPSSRRVRIEVIGNLPYPEGIDLILPQIAVFEAIDNDCSQELNRLAYHYDSDQRINTIELDCLDPNNTYWLMVDGNEEQPKGVFDIAITDLGYPEKQIREEIICEGSALEIGDKSYTQPGSFLDTIIFEGGCLEIYEVIIGIADSLFVEIDFPKIAGGEEVADGIAELDITGGSGNYLVTWEDGDNVFTKEELIGGTEYCVTIADIIGCSLTRCFEMPFVRPIRASLQNDTLNCFGDLDGVLKVTISDGLPPYQYTLFDSDKQMITEGEIVDSQRTTLSFPDLKADNYTLIISTANAVNTLIGKVIDPSPIETSILSQQDASCFGSCDASVLMITTGGSGNYKLYANDNFEEEFSGSDLCAGNYQITILDDKGCQSIQEVTITEPEAFVAKAIQTTPVKCFGEENGAATISTNGNPISYEWDNGITAMQATNLTGGIHTIIVTNEDNCIDTAFVEIAAPAPLTTAIEIIAEINCFGDTNGTLQSNSKGGNGDLVLSWSNGNQEAINDDLAAGEYTLTVTDQSGCTTTTAVTLAQPNELVATLSTQHVTCPGGPNSGSITIENITGGIAPYAYGLAENSFTEARQFNQLIADTYQVTIQDANGCEQIEKRTINAPPPLTLELGEEDYIKLGQTIQLEAITNRPVQYKWEVPDSVDCTNCSSIAFQPAASFNYAVTVTDLESECTATAASTVRVNKERTLYVPNAFSPNGDGNNDFLMVFGGNDIRTIKEFKIFSRQGSLVYEANNFTPNDASVNWKGDYNGQKAAAGVFVYYAQVEFIDGFVDVFSGDFALMR